jgi:hypothetical protein
MIEQVKQWQRTKNDTENPPTRTVHCSIFFSYDLRVWGEVALLIASNLSDLAPMVQAPSPSNSPFFKYLRRGFPANMTVVVPPEIAGECRSEWMQR